MAIPRSYKLLAQKLQEADRLELSNEDVRSALGDCLRDHAGGEYAYVANVFGDAESGDVVYCIGNEYFRAPYEIGMANGKRTHSIEFDEAVNVLPRTVYDLEADEEDQDAEMYGSMSESERQENYVERFPGSAEWKRPFAERFISKKTRDSMDDSDFAGAHRSFPIQKASDVMAAVRSIGRGVAGGQSAAALKRKIVSIAKRKGFGKMLPKSWQGDAEKEGWKPEGVLLVESATFIEQPELKEAASRDYPIKLMSPGRGTSGYYGESVLKNASEKKVFPAGTQMFWNHDTDAEESARPEGDLSRLAAVTTTDAVWDESGRDGPGLYAKAKVFSDYADQVKEKGPHIGLSIRAGGDRDEAAKGPDGKPRVITALRNAYSVDFVTKAGRDGKIFTEAATAAQTTEGDDMDEAAVKALISTQVTEAVAPLKAENKLLRERLALTQAPNAVREALATIRLPQASKEKIARHIIEGGLVPFDEHGKIDSAKLTETVKTHAAEEAEFLTQLGYGSRIPSLGKEISEADKGKDEHAELYGEAMTSMADLFVGPKSDNPLREASRNAFINGRAA